MARLEAIQGDPTAALVALREAVELRPSLAELAGDPAIETGVAEYGCETDQAAE